MGIVFDIILVAIVLLNIIIGYKKGLVKLAVSLIAVFASIILALLLYKPVSNIIINNTEIDDNLEKAIIENFTTEVEEQINKEDESLVKYIEKYVDNTANKTKNEIVVESAKVISVKVINICSIIGIFIIVRLLCLLLVFVADLIAELPILKQFNKVGGIIYGLVKALLIIYVVLAILFFITNTTGNTSIAESISSSFITKIFYEHNLLLTILF